MISKYQTPLLVICLLAVTRLECSDGLSTNTSTSILTTSPTNANNWSPMLLLAGTHQGGGVSLTTTSPPTRSELFREWYDQPNALLASETGTSRFESDRIPTTTTVSPTPLKLATIEELCVPETSGDGTEDNLSSNSSIRVASNCRTTVQKPGGGYLGNVRLMTSANQHRPSFDMTASNVFNFTNKFISPQTVNGKEDRVCVHLNAKS